MNSWTVVRAATAFSAITTPLPAANPSALMTIGYFDRSRIAYASAVVLHSENFAVGMRFALKNCFAKLLLDSRRAWSASGPTIARPRFRKASTMPLLSGISGPIKVRSIRSLLARSASREISSALIETSSACSRMPPLPGAAKIFFTFGLCARASTMACSRPPDPTTRIFILWEW